MEDYSTVIWVVAIFAAMLFNATSQARKKAKKQAHETPKAHSARSLALVGHAICG